MGIQSTIEAASHTLSPSTRRVAEVIKSTPSVVLTHTISQLAVMCTTSEASVVRFCRAIGLDGYVQLRLELATELGKESVQFKEPMDYGQDIADGSLQEIAARVASLEMLAIEETVERLDFDALDRVANAVDGAKRIVLFGVGASHFIAQDLQHKLLRIGRNAFASSDAHEAWAAASLLEPGTVAIGFSHLGRTAETTQFLSIARDCGAQTFAITSVRGSPLTEVAQESLFTEVRETPFRAGAMASRIAQLVLVDCLFLGIARLRRDETVEALRRTREATNPAREP